MKLFIVPSIIATIILSFIPSGNKAVSGSGHWEYDSYYDLTFYVYNTVEPAFYEGEAGGVAYFVTTDGDIEGEAWGCYIVDTDLQVGDEVTLTFENRITREEYLQNEEYGIESGGTRIDSGQIVGIN